MRFATAGYGRPELGFEVFGEFVKLGIAVDFNGLFGGIHDHVAFVAPMQMFVQLSLKVFGDSTIQIIGQLF